MDAGFRLMIGTPSYDGGYCAEYVRSLAATVKDIQAHGSKSLYVQVNGLHWIDNARDVLASLFLQSDCTHLLQIDADLGWPADAPRRLIAHGKDVIGGAYRIKHDAVHGCPVKGLTRDGDLYRADGVPGGFLLTSRRAIEAIGFGMDEYVQPTLDYGLVRCKPLFRRTFQGESYTGEDFAFCARAIAAGVDVWLDGSIEFEHVGRKAWRGGYAAADD